MGVFRKDDGPEDCVITRAAPDMQIRAGAGRSLWGDDAEDIYRNTYCYKTGTRERKKNNDPYQPSQ